LHVRHCTFEHTRRGAIAAIQCCSSWTKGRDRTRPGIDFTSLEIGKRYRVDWKHEQLRRTFRSTGTLLSIEVTPATPPEEPEGWLAFEVKPRFGRASVQRVDVATLRSIEPA
jgi:hypothetical protein